MECLKDKVVIVTGSSSGIGKSTAQKFATHGSLVVFTGRNQVGLEEAVQEAIKNGASAEQVVYVIADVTKEEDLEAIVSTTVNKFGKIDILVNNAGVATFGTVEDTKMEEYDELFDTNLKGPFRLTQLAIPHLKKTKGCIINVTSAVVERALPDLAVYCMTKAALQMFTDALALAMAPHQVRVNSVIPGTIKTPIQAKLGIKEDQKEEFYKKSASTIPLLRCGEAKEVADVILFLSSDASGFVTGAKVPVDGGVVLTSSWFGIPF